MSQVRNIGLVIAGLASVLFLSQCERIDPVNVVIITIDTTRADHLGCYGHPRSKTPHIDALAAEGVLFENAYTPVPITLPSHSTIMTGKVPFTHGIRDNALFVLTEEQTTLAEILQKRGYSCGAAIGSFPLLSRFGISQGFEFYDEQLGKEFEDLYGNRVIRKQRLFFDERKAALVNESAFPWLEKNSSDPFFLWLHYFDPHHPHEAPPPYSYQFASDPYLGEIAYSDECVGQVVSKLKELGVYEDTLIIVTSDHGEGNGQHNEPTHSFLAYNSTLHIPLVIKMPGGAAGRRIAPRVGTVDLVPTILNRIGIDADEDLQGKSLLPFLDPSNEEFSDAPPATLYAETLSPRLSHGLGEIRALYDGDFKYLHGPRKELFDIESDPGELKNLIQKKPGIASRMRGKLEKYLKENAIDTDGKMIAIDEETERRLMALGYLGSSGAVEVGQERLRDDGIAPQDRVADNGLLSNAKHLLHNRQPMRARTEILDLLERAPENPLYLSLLGECEILSGNSEAAIEIYERLLTMKRATAVIRPERILLMLGELNFREENYQKAVEMIEESQSFSESVEGYALLAAVHDKLGQKTKRKEALQKGLRIEPNAFKVRLDLGIHLAEENLPNQARTHFEKAIELEPYSVLAHYNYAVFSMQNGDYERALGFAQRASELNPQYMMAYHLQFELLRGSGNTAEALEVLAKAESAIPGHPLVKAMKSLSRMPQSPK